MCVCVCARASTSEPQQRPCETKWLQWIKSEWGLWISLVYSSDGQIDEPFPAETGSWFALCILSIPQSVGESAVSACSWQEETRVGEYTPTHPQHPPDWSVTSTMQGAPAASSSHQNSCTSNILHLKCRSHLLLIVILSLLAACFVYRGHIVFQKARGWSCVIGAWEHNAFSGKWKKHNKLFTITKQKNC